MSLRPYDTYIKFLVTKGVKELEELNKYLSDLRLPPVDKRALGRHMISIRSALPLPIFNTVEKKGKYTPSFLHWMDGLQLSEFWGYEFKNDYFKPVKLVYDIRSDPALRLSVEMMLIKTTDYKEIAHTINSKFSAMLTETHVEIYRKYFWNAQIMTRAAWKEYLHLPEISNSDKDIMFTALTDDIEVVKNRLGLPCQTNSADSLQRLLNEAKMKAQQYLMVNTPEGEKEARKWMEMVARLTVQYEKFRSSNLRDFSKELQLGFEYVDEEFETPDDEMMKEMVSKRESDQEEEVDSKGENDKPDTKID